MRISGLIARRRHSEVKDCYLFLLRFLRAGDVQRGGLGRLGCADGKTEDTGLFFLPGELNSGLVFVLELLAFISNFVVQLGFKGH